MKILTVIGARPQMVKASVVSRAMARASDMTEILVHTGQHYDPNMSDIFFKELGLPEPAHHLNVGPGSHGAQTGAMLLKLEEVALQVRPDCALTFGDTNSTLATALVAAKLRIPLAHVEAGIRSFNRAMPEEVNRIVVDRLSDLLFAPTQASVEQLLREGVSPGAIFLVGDVMLDAALAFAAIAAGRSSILERLSTRPRQYVLATIHRAENTDDSGRLEAIMGALAKLSGDITVILPLHPRTRARWLGRGAPGLQIIDPVGYLDMLQLERDARLIVTDSGGVQKEAFFHRVPCVTLRTETEWVELVQHGWNRVVPPTDIESICSSLRAELDRSTNLPPYPDGLYGDGSAAEQIVTVLGRKLKESCGHACP